MRILCAPDKFKGSLTAVEAAAALARGARRACPEVQVDLCPVADGGEGTVEALIAATAGQFVVSHNVPGPLVGDDQRVDARWGLLGARAGEPLTAAIEMAAASGLALVPPARRDPTLTSTYGTGVLIRQALERGARRIVLGIGGSATTDGGCGAAQALGLRFYDRRGQVIAAPITGATLEQITRIDGAEMAAAVRTAGIVVACDVTNPLTGPQGAAAVYGPQKGATPTQVAQLDRGLRHLARLMRAQLGRDVESLPGAGAAGGFGAGAVVFLHAELRPGIELVLEAVGFAQRVRACDLCLTGEGCLDGQTATGKAVIGVARAARRQGVKTVALAGCLGAGAEATLRAGLEAYYAIAPGLSQEESIRRAAELVEAAAEQAVRAQMLSDS